MTKGSTTTDVTVQVNDGDQLGVFNAEGDPHVGFVRIWDVDGKQQPDAWMLVYRNAAGQSCSCVLSITNRHDPAGAVAAAQAYLADQAAP